MDKTTREVLDKLKPTHKGPRKSVGKGLKVRFKAARRGRRRRR